MKLVESENPDLILMDIMLDGELSGIETAKIISENYNLPVIYLTALTDSETLNKAKLTDPFGFLLKPFDERSLHSSIEMGIYKHNIDTQLKEKTVELEREKIKTDQLLNNILPLEIVKELKTNGMVMPRHYNMTTILFTNFEGFTDLSLNLPPNVLISELNEIFHNFDTIIDKYGLEKLKTIGDTYMIAGGLPKEIPDHAVRVVSAALDMFKFLEERNRESNVKWLMKAGANSGQVVAGVVGMNKFTYDIWGDSVNIASRMESSSEPGKLNISGHTYNLIKNDFDCRYRGKLNAKGKGEIDMYFVNGPKNKL